MPEPDVFLKISAVAAHHGPTPAFQTIKLDRACLGSILEGSRHSNDGHKRVSGVSRNAPFLPSKQAHVVHAQSLLWANFHPPFFLL